jgi:predicted AAA+ superfamily ATPase
MSFENEDMISEIIEGIVASHLTMSMETPYLKERNTFLWFYYDTRGKEIDNVLMRDGRYLGIEVKYQSDVGPRDVTRVQEIDNYLILSKNDVVKTDDTYVVPVEAFLSVLEMSKHNL